MDCLDKYTHVRMHTVVDQHTIRCAARVTAFTAFPDLLVMIPRSDDCGFVTGSEAVISNTGALAVVAAPFNCTVHAFQDRNLHMQSLMQKVADLCVVRCVDLLGSHSCRTT